MTKRAPIAFSPERSLARKRPTKQPLPVVYIFCEGKITEPHYITSFFRDLCKDNRKVIPKIEKAAGVPYTLVEKCVEKKKELLAFGRRDSLQKRSSVWAVFDVDIHPKLREAIELARANDIAFSLSNPCIEIWGMMHLGVYERPGSRHDAQSALGAAMPPYHHDKSPIIPWDSCMSKVKQAVVNSHSALMRRNEDLSENGGANPSTNFHDLLGFLSDEYSISSILEENKKLQESIKSARKVRSSKT